ncbi:MAG: FBP domain-containing protein [Stackebrandtia sp.]
MKELTVDELRGSFANCSKREAAAIALPDLDVVAWDDLDFLGWRNPRMPQRAYLAVPFAGKVVGLVFRSAERRGGSGAMRSSMCEFCQTVHSAGGVTLFTAKKSGGAGRKGDSVGTYFCSNLECSLYVRGKKKPARVQPESTMTVEERIDRLLYKVNGIVARIMEHDARRNSQ